MRTVKGFDPRKNFFCLSYGFKGMLDAGAVVPRRDEVCMLLLLLAVTCPPCFLLNRRRTFGSAWLVMRLLVCSATPAAAPGRCLPRRRLVRALHAPFPLVLRHERLTALRAILSLAAGHFQWRGGPCGDMRALVPRARCLGRLRASALLARARG